MLRMTQAVIHRHVLPFAVLAFAPVGVADAGSLFLHSSLLACGSVELYEQMEAGQSSLGCGHFDAGTEVSIIRMVDGYVHFRISEPPDDDMPAQLVAPAPLARLGVSTWGNDVVDAFDGCFREQANLQVQFVIGQVPKDRLDAAVEYANNMCSPIAREAMMTIGLEEFMEIGEVIERDFYRAHGVEHFGADAPKIVATNEPLATDPVAPAAQRQTYNSQRQSSLGNLPGCISPGEYDKFISLNNAGRRDLADKLDCIVIPAGTEVLYLRTLGNFHKQMLWERGNALLELWTAAEPFRDALDWALRDCQTAACRERIRGEFVHE